MIRKHPAAVYCCLAASTLLSLGVTAAGARAPALTTDSYWLNYNTLSQRTFFVGSNSELYSMTYPYSHGQFTQVTGVNGRPPLAAGSGAAASTGIDAAGEVFYLTPVNGSIHVEELRGLQFTHVDLSAKANTPVTQLPAGNTALVSYPDYCAGSDNVFYIDVNHHLEWLQWSPGKTWKVSDLTKLTNAPAVQGEILTGHEGESAKEVFYATSDGHIHQLWAWSSCPYTFDGWHDTDLTALSTNSAPAALNGSSLTSYYSSATQTDSVFYVDQHFDLQQLYISTQISPIGAWSNIPIGPVTGAPHVGNGSTLASQLYLTSVDSREQVYYVTDTGTVAVLQAWFPEQGPPTYMWFMGEFLGAGFEPAAPNSPIAADVNLASCGPIFGCQEGDFHNEVYYITPAGHVQLATYWMSQVPVPSWEGVDITSSTGAPHAVP